MNESEREHRFKKGENEAVLHSREKERENQTSEKR